MTKLIQTTRELVLLHLKDLKIDEEEVTFGATLNGISKSIGSDRQEVKKVLEELLQENLIKKSVSKVRGRMRERNVHSLTKKGKKKEVKIRKKIEDRTIKVKTGQTTDIFKIKDIGEFFEREDPLIKIIQNIDDDTLDLNQDEEQKNVFVGRDKELSKLRELLEMVKKEGSKTIFIAGEAGVGKTRLISELKPYALEEGYDFLTGTCHSEIADPYLPLKEAFDKYINGEEEHSSQYRNIAFLGARKGKKIENKKMFDAERQATFYETTQTIKNIGKKDPLVVFLDDMHWTDKASADILSYITNKIDKEPILFICAYRPEDLSANHPLKDNILHMISHTPDALKIELNPLNLESTGKIIKGVLGTKNPPSHFVKAIHKKTNGNPLFVKECVKHMDEKGIIDANKNIYPKEKDSLEIPSIVQQVVERRINRIEDESKKILDIGSVIGDTVDFEVLSKVVDMNTFDLLDHIDVLVDNDLLEEDPTEEKFYFHHSLIRDAVYQELKNVKKRILHKNIAEAIEDIYSDGLGNHYSKLAHHFKKGKEYEPAYDYYLKKTEKDKEMYAHEDTIETYENILELIDKIPDSKKKKIEVWEGLGETYNIIGEYEKSRKYLRKILDEKVDPKTEIKVYRMISNGFLQQGHFDEAEEVIEKGLSIQNDEDKDSKEYCRLLSNKGWAVMRKGKHDETLEIFKETNEIANRMNDEWLIAQSLHS
ncbi:MAG: ATP-binding protein, partial [Thermoplasmatota archaeon]